MAANIFPDSGFYQKDKAERLHYNYFSLLVIYVKADSLLQPELTADMSSLPSMMGMLFAMFFYIAKKTLMLRLFYPKAILKGWTKMQDMLEKPYTMSFHVKNLGFCPLKITLKYSEICFRFFFMWHNVEKFKGHE